jgi:RNA polymerase sigma factor (TIGR02999 family)
VSEATLILSAIEQGEPGAASQLLPLVYDELRRLAAQKLAHEQPGQTLEPTALVHEAYLRLVAVPQQEKKGEEPPWDSRGHFFAAAAEAMRRILVENARRKQRVKHGGGVQHVDLHDHDVPVQSPPDEIIALDEALTRLAAEDPEGAQVVQLHFFAGLSMEETAQTLGISRATAYRQWAFARAWLGCAIGRRDGRGW